MKEKYYKLDIRDDTSILDINIPKGKYAKFFHSVGERLYIYWEKEKKYKWKTLKTTKKQQK